MSAGGLAGSSRVPCFSWRQAASRAGGLRSRILQPQAQPGGHCVTHALRRGDDLPPDQTEARGALGDQEVRLGDPDPTVGHLENPLKTHVAGGFAASGAVTRYFLLGKYKVSMLQYQSVMSDTCPQAVPDLRLPQANVSWYDAAAYSNSDSLWLLKNARDRLPQEGEEVGFVRLPTEAEWEFAARGGRRVSASDFEARTFPMPEGMNRYVWYAGTDSANGKAQIIGGWNRIPWGSIGVCFGNVGQDRVRSLPPHQALPFAWTGWRLRHPRRGFSDLTGLHPDVVSP